MQAPQSLENSLGLERHSASVVLLNLPPWQAHYNTQLYSGAVFGLHMMQLNSMWTHYMLWYLFWSKWSSTCLLWNCLLIEWLNVTVNKIIIAKICRSKLTKSRVLFSYNDLNPRNDQDAIKRAIIQHILIS